MRSHLSLAAGTSAVLLLCATTAAAAGAPAVENVVILLFLALTVVWFGSETNIEKVSDSAVFVLGLGATLAVATHAALQWWGARRAGMPLTPSRGWHDNDVKVVVRRMVPALAQRYGVERFMWASDFPHADHTSEYIHDLNELVAMFPEDQRRPFIGDNARALFKLA